MELDMNGLVVPNMQVWYRQNSFISTPDNGLLYYSRSDVNYIAPLVKGQLPQVKIINVKSTIKALACSPDWSERREFATLDEQNNLLLWDVDQGNSIKGHKGHMYKLCRVENRGGQSNEVTSAICFTLTEKIISCEYSVMIIYCLVTDTYKIYGDFIKPNNTVVVISPCPTDRDIFAVGMKKGLIQLISIRDMTVIRNMRGHDKEIVSIDWMQIRVKPEQANWRQEERPKKEAHKKNGNKTRGNTSAATATENSEIFDIYDYNENEEEFGTIIDRESSSYDQRDRFRDKVHSTEGFNFLEECQNLKEDLINARQQQEQDSEDVADDAEKPHEINTDDENELDEAEKFRDFIIVDDEGKEDAEEVKDDEEEGDLKMILVTGSRENAIFFWDHESGVAIDKIMLASKQSSNNRLGIFITAAWMNPTKIVANNASGNVYEWNLSFFYRASRVRMTATQNPNRYPVDMAIYLVRSRGPIGGGDPKGNYVWCQSINRKIVGVSVTKTPEIVADLTCLATGNTCIAENPLESTILAIGCIDRKLATLNLASLAYNDVTCVPFMNKICSKVTALDWHPVRENYIAFGTAEGRIGILDTNGPNNVPVLMNSFLSTDVYTLKWCEMTDEFHQKTMVLFATGKSKIAYYKIIGVGKHDPIELHQFGMVSSVSASGHYLFVGTQDGFVFINDLSKSLTQLYHRSISRRYICSMQFKDNVLAVASNEINIRLIDFSNGMDDKVDDNITTLTGHLEGVCCLRWGHGDSKLLVSASFDDTVRVWDTANGSCIAVYRSIDSVFCAIFSPIQENIVILTGKGITLSFFDYTKYPVTEHSLVKKPRVLVKWAMEEKRNDKKALRDRKRADKPLEQLQKSLDTLQISDNAPAPDVVAVAVNGDLAGHIEVEEKPTAKSTPNVDELADHLKEIKFKEIKPAQLNSNVPTTFHLTYREINKPADVLACIVKLTSYEEPNEDVDENGAEEQLPVISESTETDEKRYFNEKLFTSEKDLKELIEEETKNHIVAHTASIGTILLPQIGFRLKEEIIRRIASKTLTDQLVALAPSISYEFWRKCCEAYGYQFLEKQYTLASIPYFLASHKITEAIDYLCKHKFFREAWAICKLRKAQDDPTHDQVATEWARYLETNGNFEAAALVWTASKNYKNAVTALLKRQEITEDIQRAIDALTAKQQQSTE
ncbi:protein rigor mortis isoform X2 [Ochlerotatus camptorhynchus]|uniref:protein rigor mortis isoform X2 n=1 Tax=Ochlerotatus camptorhynchus TaxID=644619 RepID=UPI0031CEB6F5